MKAFKVLLKALAILAVSAVVCGGLVLLSQSSSASALIAPAGGRGAMEQGRMPPPGGDGAFRPERGFGPGHGMEGGRGEMGHEGSDGFSMAGLSGVGMQAAKVAGITVVIVLAQAGIGWITRKRKPRTQATGTA